jgi:hypothetical protein
MNARLAATCHRLWDEQILPALHDYIAIPAKSPMFDKDWAAAVTSSAWCATRRPGSNARKARKAPASCTA